MRRILKMEFWRALFKKPPPELPEETKPKKAVQNNTPFTASLVRSELNLEKNQVFTVSTYKGRSREYIAEKTTTAIGETLERKITVGRMPDGTETGVLTIHHFKIYLALLEIWEKAGKPINEAVHFTVYKIIKRLDLADSGQNYERLKRWLQELRYIPISFAHSFYGADGTAYEDLSNITILNKLRTREIKNIGKAKKTRGYGEFRFDDYILHNLLGNYVHPLRLDIITSFKKRKDLCILLYIYIDRNLAFKDKFEINLRNLFDNLDLSQDYVRYPSQRKMVIEPVLEELESKPLSTGILTYCKVQKTKDDKDYKLVCRKRATKQLQAAAGGFQQLEARVETEEEIRERETARINTYKESLSTGERAKLREKAEADIRNCGQYKEEFITEFLIDAKENDLIREQISKKMSK